MKTETVNIYNWSRNEKVEKFCVNSWKLENCPDFEIHQRSERAGLVVFIRLVIDGVPVKELEVSGAAWGGAFGSRILRKVVNEFREEAQKHITERQKDEMV